MTQRHLLRQSLHQLSVWLPALLMVLFALGTWWLVRNTPKLPDASAERPVSSAPDYFMRDFSVRVFDPDGRLKSELIGVEGHHFPATDTLEVQNPRMRSIDETGRLTTATARRGESNGDGSEIKLYGDAHVVREPHQRSRGEIDPRMEFRGEFLHAFVDEDRVSSDQPVELWRGPNRFTGDTLEYDNRTGVGHLQGRVRGVLQPASTRPSKTQRR